MATASRPTHKNTMGSNSTGSLDTNTLLRLVLGDVAAQSTAVDVLLAQSSVLDVADIAIIEMVFVLEKVYMMPRTDIVSSITAIIRHPKIRCNQKLFERTLADYLKQTKLSIVDCALVHYAVINDAAPLYTFDQALAKANPDQVHLLT